MFCLQVTICSSKNKYFKFVYKFIKYIMYYIQNRQIKAHMKKAQTFARDLAANLGEGFEEVSLFSLVQIQYLLMCRQLYFVLQCCIAAL